MTTYLKKDKILIFGSDSDLAKSIFDVFKEKYDLIGYSRNTNNRTFKNIKCNFQSKKNILSKTKEVLIKKNSIKSIIILVGSFKRSKNNYDKDKSEDFVVTKNIFEVITNLLIKRKINLNIITITSMDSIFPNINSYKYSIGKSSISTLIKLYKKNYQKNKISFTEIAPGPINTKMRKNKKENKKNILQPEDIAQVCLMLSSANENVSFDTIKIYPKKWNYNFY